jgi:diacylglycerol kinase (ATP)
MSKTIPFKSIHIIFNPNSTGDSPAIAKQFKKEATQAFPDLLVNLIETQHAGHAEELAYDLTRETTAPLLVSVSGDGGYHELINGALRAVDEQLGRPFCAVLPGGNANDHYTQVYDRPLLEALVDAQPTSLDVLAITHGDSLRYAHSYAGLGITPQVAMELNKHSLSTYRELLLCIQSFMKLRPFELHYQDRTQRLDSLIISNIAAMAKVITLDEDSDPTDGLFEVVVWQHDSKLQLLTLLLRSAIGKPPRPEKSTLLEFRTTTPLPMQLDGEIIQLTANRDISVRLARARLTTFL